jgi:lipopolysaccharide export system permease protein
LIVKRTTLARYLISEILPPFGLGLLAFTLVLLIARVVKLIELVVTRGVPALEIGKLLLLVLPTFLELTVPMAFLLAILLGLGRLAQDHEVLAFKASGISPLQILAPIAALAVIVSMLTLFLTVFARPAANLALKKDLYDIARSRLGTALKEKVFNQELPKVLIYVEELIPPGNTAQGILIIDTRDRIREDVILGKVARISADESTNSLGLKIIDGSLYQRERDRPGFSQTRFNIYDFKLDLDELLGPVRKKSDGPKELPFTRLLETIREKQLNGGSATAERMELHQRISFAFVPLVFALLGVALSLLPQGFRSGRSWGFFLCLFWLLAYYLLLTLGKTLGENGLLHPAAALWLPNLVVGAVAVQLFLKALRESPLALPGSWEHAFSWAGSKWMKIWQRPSVS